MDETHNLLRAIINGQSALKSELLISIDRLKQRLSGRMDSLDAKIDAVEARLTKRIDQLGAQLAYLEDDAVSQEEFKQLQHRVVTLEQNQL